MARAKNSQIAQKIKKNLGCIFKEKLVKRVLVFFTVSFGIDMEVDKIKIVINQLLLLRY